MPIPQYTGAWGKAQVLHLLRRTTLGVKKTDVNYFMGLTMSQAVTELLTIQAMPSPPLNDYNTGSSIDPTVPLGDTWVNDIDANGFDYFRHQSLRAWWAGLLMNENRNIRERMTLFLHNYLPVNMGNDPSNAVLSYEYLNLLRTNALGNYKTLIRDISIDRAMLQYLNGDTNTKTQANENYARELQELFTIGKDLPAYYTQNDVLAAAKVLTGWILNQNSSLTQYTYLQRYFDTSKHDATSKTFSSFYNNTVITGDASATGGMTELNALIDMIFNNDEVAKYFVRRLYRYFVYYKITPTIETNIIIPLANTFRSSGYNIKTVLQELLLSQHFYETQSVGCMIKSPIEMVVGVARTFGLTFPTDVVNEYKSWRVLYDRAKDQQLQLGSPPNVSGWPAMSNSPFYHELWINSDTLRTKKSFLGTIANNGYNSKVVKIDALAFTATLDTPGDPNLLIDEVLELLHTIPTDAAIKTQLKSILLSNQVGDYYWTNIWTTYINTPTNTSNKNTAESRLKTLYQTILNMAETNLC
jgi:uncharacterized protein (DUF1800 family)